MPFQMAQKSAFTWSWAWLGTLASTLRSRWTRHRWRAECEKTSSTAPMSPAPPSETTRSGSPSPRAVIERRKSRQASVDSDDPGSIERSTGLPSVVIPQATRTGSGPAWGCILKCDPSR
jgi:hypothetical protein